MTASFCKKSLAAATATFAWTRRTRRSRSSAALAWIPPAVRNANCSADAAKTDHADVHLPYRPARCTVSVLFIGKRFYTNRDALREQFGRIYQLPWHWANAGIATQLWLVDYHSRERVSQRDCGLEVVSTPVRNLAVFRRWIVEVFRRRQKPDVVVASGDCYIGLVAYGIAKQLRARFVFDVYDKYDEFGGYRRLLRFDPFRYLLQHANHRLFASRGLMATLRCDSDTDHLVPNGVDTRRFRPMDKARSRCALGLPESATLVGYFGSMEPDRGVDDLIAAVQSLRNSGMPVELLLGGKARPGLDLAQPGIRHLGNLPFAQVPTALACCDVLSVPYRRSDFMDAGASNKIAEAIACGRPLVATRSPNFAANFPAQAAQLDGVLATPGNADDIARVISAQLRNRTTVEMPVGISWPEIANPLAHRLSLFG